MKKFTLNETDLRYMIHRAINEIISLEGEGEDQYPSDRYYFDSGWDRNKYKDNPFTAEGPVGKGFEKFVSELQDYVQQKMETPNRYDEYIRRCQERLDEYLEMQKADFERLTRKNPEWAERIVRRNQEKSQTYTWLPGTAERITIAIPEYLHSFQKNYKKYKAEDYEKLVGGLEAAKRDREREEKYRSSGLRIVVEMPGESEGNSLSRRTWRDMAQIQPPAKAVRIDPENIEASAAEAWDIFNEYASQTKEVIGWWAWQWSTFPPTIKPILTPEVGKIISDTHDDISRFYSSYGPGDYVGD
jgi:hypothetical protein